jgi:predicted regulator of Ras-like GTPase activity (Roadblock/LC7/MglB family)
MESNNINMPLSTASAETVNANLEELQETVSRLSSHKGVEAVIILNRDGDILAESSSSSLIVASGSSSQQQQQEPSESNGSGDAADDTGAAAASPTPAGASTATTARSVNQLLRTATAYLQSLSPEDEVSFLQIRSTQHREIYISPHQGYVLAVVKR